MIQGKRYGRRCFAAVLALLLALAALTPGLTLPAEAVNQADIDALKDDASDLAAQRKTLQ